MLLIYGPNGVGKTTLLKTIAGFLKPLCGRILLDKEDITRIKRKIFYIDERVELPESVTTLDYFRIIGSLYGFTDRRFLSDKLSDFGLDPKMRIREMSQGQRRRLQIAGAIAARNAKLFVIDDPAVGMDDFSAEHYLPAIVDRLLEHGKIVVMSTKTARMREVFEKASILNLVEYRIQCG